MSEAWQSAYAEFEHVTLPKLRQAGKAIGASANAGNKQAQKVIMHYSMLQRSFDPLTLTLLQQALKEWQAVTGS